MKHLFFIFSIFIFTFSFSSHAKINQPYGLFFIKDGASEEGKEIFEVPTLKTEVDVEVQGLLTTTTVKQHFINPTNTFMEAVYLFPLPEKSGVDHLIMIIGDRFINGVIQEKKEAEETYQEAKKSGKKTSLISSSRSNIFKTKVANIAPGELVVIEIRYHDTLGFNDGSYSLRIPTVINHRFTLPKKTLGEEKMESNYILDPEIHSPINDKNYTINPYSIRVNLNVGFAITPPQSQDSLNVEKISGTHYKVALAEGTMPSTKDFVLSFSPVKSPDPYIEIYGEEIEDDLYLYGLINPQIEPEDLQLMKQTAITVIADISGSMSGNSVRQLKSLLTDFINQLPEQHYLNVIAFNDTHFKLFDEPKIVNTHNRMRALQFVRTLEAEGGTYMLPPVYESLLESSNFLMKHQIVLMTDGNIGYDTEMMAVVHEHLGKKRFHVVGIGSAPNSLVVKNLAKVGRGSHLYSNDAKFKEKARQLLYKINRPVIENLRLFMIREHEVLPNQFPDVLANEPITFFMKLPYTRLEDLTDSFALAGSRNSMPWKFTVKSDQIQEGKFLDQLWAREKVETMTFLRSIGYLDQTRFEKKVIELALRHHLVTQYTSLVAVDNNISRVPSQPILSHQIAQNIPDGWVDPEIVKQSKMLQQENLQTPLQALYKVDLNSMPALQVHFVQTATKKDLFYLLASLLFGSSALLFFIRRRFH